MNFELNEEQALLRESALRWVADRTGSALPEAVAARWKEMAGFGWLAMTLPDPFIPAILEAAALRH